MKKVFLFVLCVVATTFISCSDGDSEGADSQAFHGIVGWEQALTLKQVHYKKAGEEHSYTCRLTMENKRVCEEINTVTKEVTVKEDGSFQFIDPAIEEAIGSACKGKTLAISLSLAYSVPEIDMDKLSVYGDDEKTSYYYGGESISQSEAQRINEAYRKELMSHITQARRAALDAFVALEVIELSDGQKAQFLASNYGGLEIVMPACDYATLIQKAQSLIEIAELGAVVKDFVPKACDTALKYDVLLQKSLTQAPQGVAGPLPQKVVITKKEDLQALQAYGLESAVVDGIDFESEVVVAIFAQEQSSRGYKYAVDHACSGEALAISLVTCVNTPKDTSLSWPMLVLKLPKGTYEIALSARDLICQQAF